MLARAAFRSAYLTWEAQVRDFVDEQVRLGEDLKGSRQVRFPLDFVETGKAHIDDVVYKQMCRESA